MSSVGKGGDYNRKLESIVITHKSKGNGNDTWKSSAGDFLTMITRICHRIALSNELLPRCNKKDDESFISQIRKFHLDTKLTKLHESTTFLLAVFDFLLEGRKRKVFSSFFA